MDFIPKFDDLIFINNKNTPISNEITNFKEQHQDIFDSDQKSVELIISHLEIYQYTKQKYPDRKTIFTKMIKTDTECVSFDYRLKSIYKTSPHFLHQLNCKNQHGYIVHQKIFYVPRFYDVLRTLHIDLSLPNYCVACSTVFLEGTLLAQTFHNQSTTLNINVSQSQTSFGCVRVYVDVYSHVPCYKNYHIKASTNNIIIKHNWLRELLDLEFPPIQPEFSLLTEFGRIALLDKTPPLMMNGWPFLMPHTVSLRNVTLTKQFLKKRVTKPSNIIEFDIGDLTFIFPSGTTIKI